MLELGTIIKDCVLFFDGKESISFPELSTENVDNYLGNIPQDIKIDNLWYDLKDKKVFSEYQFTVPKNAGKEQNFFLPPGDKYTDFLYEKYISEIRKNSVFSGQEELVNGNCECIISQPEKYFKFKNRKIMIVAGGPSSKDIQWDNINYDYLWTVNEYYKNEELRNKKIDLLYLSSIVEFENENLIQSVENSNALLTFPLVTNYLYDNVKLSKINNLINKFEEQSTYNYTRYSSTLGVGYKLIVLAIYAGASEIYTVGNDGFISKNMKHAFDGTKQSPNWYIQYGNRFQDRQFVIFWSYIKKLQKYFDFQIYNLGEGKEYNISSSITEQYFPPNQEAKNVIYK